jgi:hypothetical protein
MWRYLWLVALFGGASVLVAVLHPASKSDSRATPMALFGLVIARAGTLIEFRPGQNHPARNLDAPMPENVLLSRPQLMSI